MSTLKVNKIQPNSSNHISIDGNTTITGSLVHKGHTTLAGTNVLSGSTVFIGSTTVEGDLTVGGKLTAQEVRTEFDNAAVVFESGSTKFGDSTDDNHAFTGSLGVQGGTFKVTDSGVDVLIANSANGAFSIGDTTGLGDQAFIIGDSSVIKVNNNGKTTLSSDSNNRIGIGTVSPSGSFHVAVNSSDSNREFVRFTNGNATLFNINEEGQFSIGDVNNIGDGAYLKNHGDEFSFMFGATKGLSVTSTRSYFNEALEIKNTSGGDATLTLQADTANTELTGENDNPAILFKQDGGAKNAAVGFNIIDDTSNGTVAGTGNRFWIVNSMADNVGEGGITFGTALVDGWDNAVARFMIRGDGKGLFGHPNDNYDKSLGAQFEVYDDRTENTTTDYTLASYGYIDISEYPPSQGAGGIISRVKVVDGATDLGTHAIGMVAGTTSAEVLTTGDFAFYAGSNMDTSNATGFSGVIHSGSSNWQIGGTAPSDTDTGRKLTVVGTAQINSDLHIGGNLHNSGSTSFKTSGQGVVWSMNTDGASIRFYNTADGDADSRLEFNTRDNNNEYFKWTHSTAGGTYESMRLDPINSGSNSKLTVNGDIFADSLTIGGSDNVNNNSHQSSSIAGGQGNTINGALAFIGSGRCNTVDGSYSSVVGGQCNRTSAPWSTISAGLLNCVNFASYAGAVVAGTNNNVATCYSLIGAGACNGITDYADYSSISAGCRNTISGKSCHAFIGGGQCNTILGSTINNGHVIAGGCKNKIDAGSSCNNQFIGGGSSNYASKTNAVVVGGQLNSGSGYSSVIVGGSSNCTTGDTSFIGGGSNNTATGYGAVIAGGRTNENKGSYSTIPGGYSNYLASTCSNIAGGSNNCIDGPSRSTIGGGRDNIITGSGDYALIAGGFGNSISGSSTCAVSILGGVSNSITSGSHSSILGGCMNQIKGGTSRAYYNTIGSARSSCIIEGNLNSIASGIQNRITNSNCSVIGGGSTNRVVGSNQSTINGGSNNCVTSSCFGSIGGGFCNTFNVGGFYGTIAGGRSNKTSCYSFIGGGAYNTTNYAYSVIAGGYCNTLNQPCSGILGGASNTVNHQCSFIIGKGLTSTAANYTFVNNLCNVGGGTSDSRLKENIVNIPYGLTQVSQLEPVSFTFKDDDSKKTKYGFIAQCVQEVMPELVYNHPTDTVDGTPVLQFDKDAVWASTVNAVKELKQEIEALKAEISILKQK